MRWFWQKPKRTNSQGEPETKREDRRYVRVYDFDTKTVHSMPAAELAPGMICARTEGVEGEVWVDGARLQKHDYQHPPFSEEVRDILREIHGALDEVYPMTLAQWEDGFRRDRTPAREIAYWQHLAQVYSRQTAPDAGEMTLEKKHHIFKVLVTCGVSPREEIVSLVTPTILTQAEVEAIVADFYADGNDDMA